MPRIHDIIRWCLAIAIGGALLLVSIEALAAPGSLDAAFGTGGIVRTRAAPSSDYAAAVAVQPDGKIVVAGASEAGAFADADFALARYNPDGTLDASFGLGGRVVTAFGTGNDWALAVAIQADGKIVAGGYSFNGTNNDFALARYNTDGSLDTSFGTGGKVVTASAAGNDGITGIAIQTSDGRIVVSGYVSNGANSDFAVARYNTNGSLDATFGSGGKVVTPFGTANDQANAVVIQTDGKIVAAGHAFNGTNNDFVLARYNSNGSLDGSFGSGGKLTTAFVVGGLPRASRANALALQANGRIVVAGQASNGSNDDFAVARYTTAGVLDTTFNSGGTPPGTVVTPVNSSDEFATSVVVLADGRIVVAGSTFNGVNSYDFAYARYNSNGSLSPSILDPFGDPAIRTITVSTNWDRLGQMALQADGKMVFVGESHNGANYDFVLVRWGTLGAIDSAFGTNGIVRTEFYNSGVGEWRAVARQPDGKLVAAGFGNNGANEDFALARVNADGSPDASFGAGGKIATPIGTGNERAQAVAVQADGKIVAAGFSFNGSNNDFALVRYNADGTLDTTFGCASPPCSGKVTTDFSAASAVNDAVNAIAIQSDGKIVVAGVTDANFALARYNPNGTLDTSFNGIGKVSTDFLGSADAASALAIQTDGKIVAAGYASNLGGTTFALARYNANGLLDTAGFGTGTGKVTTSFGVSNSSEVHGIAIQGDGRIVAAGRNIISGQNYDFALARYNANGTLDASFDADGILTTPFGSSDDEAWALALQPNGSAVAAGSTKSGANYSLALARYSAVNGSLDASFGTSGKAVTALGTSAIGYAMVLQPDGRAVVGGSASPSPGFALARYDLEETPAPFAFAPQTGLPFGATVTSNAITISGLTGPASLSVVNGQYSIGCTGTFTAAAGSISNGQTVCVRHTTAASALGSTVTTLYAGTATATFVSITYGFAPVRRAAPGAAITSETVTLAGLAGPSAISVSGGLYSVNGGAFASSAGTVSNGDTLQLRLTSSAQPATSARATLTVGGSSAVFSVTTKADLAAGLDHNIAISTAGEVWSWGGNNLGKLGNGSTTNNSSMPVRAPGLTGVTAVAGGMSHTLAVRSDGTVWAWGQNAQARLGNNDVAIDQCDTDPCAKQPVQVPGIANAVAVAAGWGHSLALKADGTVVAWGYNQTRAVGDGTTAFSVGTPQQVIESGGGALANVVAIAAGYFHSAALKADGTVWTWGRNGSGELGIGASADQNRAQAIASLSGVVAIAAKGVSTLALKSDGTVRAWGDNVYGELGDGTNLSRNAPVTVSGLAGVTAIAAGWSFGMARKNDGTVWTWGLDNKGQLGDGTTTSRNAPVQATQFGVASAIVGGGAHSLAVTAAGAILARGDNASGQLGFEPATPGLQYQNVTHDPNNVVTPQIAPPSSTSVGTASSAITLGSIDVGVAFATQLVGVPSAPKQLLFRNSGFSAITVSGISVTSGDFSQTNTCGSSVEADTNCTIDVTFTPAAAGARSAALIVSSDSSDGSTITMQLSGTAQASTSLGLVASGATVNFGQPVTFTATLSGASAPTGSVTFKDGAATLASVSVSGGAAAYNTNTLSIGVHNITAEYPGDANNTASVSSSVPVTIVSAPTVPAGLAASAVSSSQINLSWTASTDTVGVTAYKIYRGGALQATTGNVTSYSDSGLSASTTYSYTVAACNAAAHCSVLSASASATTLAAGMVAFTPSFVQGFNQTGNPFTTPLDVHATYGCADAPVPGVSDKIDAVWAWNATTHKWQFHTPQSDCAYSVIYAAANGFEVLTIVPPGTGYWVSAYVPVILPARFGLPFIYDEPKFDALPPSFSLLATGGTLTVSQFNVSVGATQSNFIALWGWDVSRSKWYFYSPSLEPAAAPPYSNAQYCTANGYQDFAGGTPPAPALSLQPGVGFWIEK